MKIKMKQTVATAHVGVDSSVILSLLTSSPAISLFDLYKLGLRTWVGIINLKESYSKSAFAQDLV